MTHEECEARCELKVAQLNTKMAGSFVEVATLMEESAELLFELAQSHIELTKRVEFLETMLTGGSHEGTTVQD